MLRDANQGYKRVIKKSYIKFGYELREYLLNKWDRKCAYCGAENLPLQIEHIHPKAKGGTNRVSNLCLACESCNIKKGTQDIEVFLKKKPDIFKNWDKLWNDLTSGDSAVGF
jgi:5-methylcytosine-specific restriction endonuclease McrA